MSQQLYGDDIKSHDNQIHGLVKLGLFSIVKDYLIHLSKEDQIYNINSIDQRGRTLLIHAVMLNNKNAVHWLLENGADITKTDVMGYTALTLAKKYKYIEIINMINKHILT